MASELDCNPDDTVELFELFQTPPEERDAEWIEDFLSVVPTASLQGVQPQIQRGPDGFPYLILSMPEPGQDFDAYSVKHALPYCLKHGCGIAIFSDPKNSGRPEWVFSFGSLWSFDRFGNFIGDPEDEAPDPVAEKPEAEPAAAVPAPGGTADADVIATTLKEPRQVMIAAPSDEFIPPYARTAIARFLKDTLGLEGARVAVVVDPEMKPSRALMFADLQPERFEKQEQFIYLMRMLRWFLPATRGLMAGVPQLAEHTVPL